MVAMAGMNSMHSEMRIPPNCHQGHLSRCQAVYNPYMVAIAGIHGMQVWQELVCKGGRTRLKPYAQLKR